MDTTSIESETQTETITDTQSTDNQEIDNGQTEDVSEPVKEDTAFDLDKVDPSTLPPELQGKYKSMQGDYTRKTQALAEERKRFSEEKRQFDESRKLAGVSKAKTIQDVFDINPEGVLAEINARLEIEEEKDFFSDEVKRLRKLKDNLLLYGMKKTETRLNESKQKDELEAYNNDVYITARKDIEGFDEKVTPLIEHAIEKMGFSREEIFDFVIVKRKEDVAKAVKFLKTINRDYEFSNAGKSAEGKIKTDSVKPNKAGAGNTEKKPSPNFKNAFEKAQKLGTTDAWAEYLALTKAQGDGG